MRALIFLLLASPIAFALVGIPAPIPYPPADSGIPAGITIDSAISADNMESAKYKILLSNQMNATIYLTLPISFGYKPESISIERNGEPVELTVETEQKGGFSRYTDRIGMGPGENVTYVLTYKALKTPTNYGIWGLGYSYTAPVSFFEAMTGNTYVPVRPQYSGEIRFGYKIDKVSCSGCSQTDDTIKIGNPDYFGLSWEKKRTPIRAGIFYVLMLSGIAFSIARARRTPTKTGKKGKSAAHQ